MSEEVTSGGKTCNGGGGGNVRMRSRRPRDNGRSDNRKRMSVLYDDLEVQLTDTCTLRILSEEKLQYVNTSLSRAAATLYDATSDVRLRVGGVGQTFRAHRAVLAAASTYFATALAGQQRPEDVVEVAGVSGTGLAATLEYFYRAHVTLTVDTVADVLEAARLFGLEWPLAVGCDFLVRRVALDRYQLALELAERHALGDLTDEIFRFVGRSFTQLCREGRAERLSFALLARLLAEDHFIDAPESLLLDAVLRWKDAAPEERGGQLPALLASLRFPLMSEADLDAVPAVEDAPEIAKRVARARRYVGEPSSQCLSTDGDTRVRASRPVVMLLSALDDLHLLQYKVPGVSEFFSEEISAQFLDTVFRFSASCMLGNFLFVAGGYDRDTWSSSKSVFRFDPRNRSWAQLSPMLRPRVSFVLVAAPGSLYAVGGIDHTVENGVDREQIVSALDRYEPRAGLWKACAALPVGVFNAAASVMPDGTLWLTGGIFDSDDESVPSKKTQVYDPASDSWSVKPDMLESRHSHASFQRDGKLFVFGGLTGGDGGFAICRSAELFDPEVDQWSVLIELPAELGQVLSAVAQQDDFVYLLSAPQPGSERFLVCYDAASNAIVSTEYCGDHVQQLVSARVLLPFDDEVFTTIPKSDGKSNRSN